MIYIGYFLMIVNDQNAKKMNFENLLRSAWHLEERKNFSNKKFK